MPDAAKEVRVSRSARLLARIERVGNRLPDPVMLFVLLLGATFAASAMFAGTSFEMLDRATGLPATGEVMNLLTGRQLAEFTAGMVNAFITFHPLGVVLVAMLGLGVAEHSGFVQAALKRLLALTPRALLTPMLALAAVLSHTAADAGYVLVIPMGGIMFRAAGRHPLAGIAAAFAGVSGGFGANFLPSALDPLLQGITQAGARLVEPDVVVNPLCNWYFAAGSSLLVVLVVWYLTDRVVEPRLRGTVVDVEEEAEGKPAALTARESRALWIALGAFGLALAALAATALPQDSPWRFLDASNPEHADTGSLVAAGAPLMRSIVPLIFLLSLVPGVVYGFAAGVFRSHRDVITGMARAMETMGAYIVLAFFAALFIKAFGDSNLGALIATRGADLLQSLALPSALTLLLVILLVAAVNLGIGSASAKWALLAPVLVPMLMQAGLTPEAVQAAYRVGDSTTNIITPLMPYFPLVVVYARRHVSGAGLGTLLSLMLPYSLTLLTLWSLFFLAWWGLGLPFGLL